MPPRVGVLVWALILFWCQYTVFAMAATERPLRPVEKWLFWAASIPTMLVLNVALVVAGIFIVDPACMISARARTLRARGLSLLIQFQRWYLKRMP